MLKEKEIWRKIYPASVGNLKGCEGIVSLGFEVKATEGRKKIKVVSIPEQPLLQNREKGKKERGMLIMENHHLHALTFPAMITSSIIPSIVLTC